MVKGEQMLVTDGKGNKGTATIVDHNRKKCAVEISQVDRQEKTLHPVTIAVSLIKNSSRFEWFLEKATEIGVSEIIPLICERTEKQKFRLDRMKNIMVSAMLQSQQSWLPQLHEPGSFEAVVSNCGVKGRYIAHCLPSERKQLSGYSGRDEASIILIGPEGDFTEKEIQLALQHNFTPVALGNTRLRTETAAIVAATLLTNTAN